MTIRAVLFDFSNTLFRLEHPSFALHGELMRALTAPLGLPDGLAVDADTWERRDLDPVAHREAHVEALASAGAEDPDGFYESLLSPTRWQAYPDTAVALGTHLRTAVVSNIGWDVRSVFARHGVLGRVDEFVLSYEEGVVKPDPKLFEVACERLGVEPGEALMIGDSEEADGGARAVGCRFELVEPLPTQERPDALLNAISRHA